MKKDVYRNYIETFQFFTQSESMCMSIAKHIYVFNNPAYTTKITSLEFKKK